MKLYGKRQLILTIVDTATGTGGALSVGFCVSIVAIMILWKDENPGDVHKYELFYYDIFKMMSEKINIEEFTKEYGFVKILEILIKNKNFREQLNQQMTTILRDTVSHVLYFLLCEDAKNAVLNKFKQTLIEVIKAGTENGIYPSKHEITIISHSLGTVVAYMGLYSIIGDKKALGQIRKIKNLFTLATPLGLIQKVSRKIKIKELPHITKKIEKPAKLHHGKKRRISNIRRWYSYRHKSDPIASLVPFVGTFLGNANEPPFVFDKIHTGNVHAFENYIEQARDVIIDKIKE